MFKFTGLIEQSNGDQLMLVFSAQQHFNSFSMELRDNAVQPFDFTKKRDGLIYIFLFSKEQENAYTPVLLCGITRSVLWKTLPADLDTVKREALVELRNQIDRSFTLVLNR
jgi:hypothetical protein